MTKKEIVGRISVAVYCALIALAVWYTWGNDYEWLYVAYALVTLYQIEINTRKREFE